MAADWARVFERAAELDKAVEVDGYPDRQDEYGPVEAGEEGRMPDLAGHGFAWGSTIAVHGILGGGGADYRHT